MSALFASQIAACTLVSKTVELPFEAVRAVIPGAENLEPINPVDLQEEMLRFADHFMESTIKASSTLQRNGQAIDHSELVKIKVRLTSETLAMVTTSNSIGTLIDLLMMTSAARMWVEDHWMPKVYGDSAKPLLQALSEREKEIWMYSRKVVPEKQLEELRTALDLWRKDPSNQANTDMETIASLQLINKVKNASHKRPDFFESTSVFKLLDLDPLAGLDPATRELTETRLLGDRALFIGQRMPQLIEWQMELLTLRTAELPEIKAMVDSTSVLASSGDRISQTFQEIPGLIRSEREQLFKSIKSEKQGILDVGKQYDQTFSEGSKMAESIDKALKTYSDLLKQMDESAKTSNSEPFRIQDWTETAIQISNATQQLDGLLTRLPQTLDADNQSKMVQQIEAMSKQVKAEGESMLKYVFVLGTLFVAVSCLLLLATGLLYRALSAKLFASSIR